MFNGVKLARVEKFRTYITGVLSCDGATAYTLEGLGIRMHERFGENLEKCRQLYRNVGNIVKKVQIFEFSGKFRENRWNFMEILERIAQVFQIDRKFVWKSKKNC